MDSATPFSFFSFTDSSSVKSLEHDLKAIRRLEDNLEHELREDLRCEEALQNEQSQQQERLALQKQRLHKQEQEQHRLVALVRLSIEPTRKSSDIT